MAWVENRAEAAMPVTLGRLHRWSARADELAVGLAPTPLRALRNLLLFTLATLAVGIPLGELVRGDAALWLREGMPGTWVSAAVLGFTAVIARAALRREAGSPAWHQSFWGLSAAIFALLVCVELLQPTMFASHWLEDRMGAVAPFGIENVDAFLMIAVMLGVALILAPRALVLRRHPLTLGLLCVGAVIAIACQALDSFMPGDELEFVLEDGLKSIGETFILAGFLAGLRDHLR